MTLGKRFGRSYILVACLTLVMAVGSLRSAQASLITVNFQGTVTSVDAGLGPPFASGQTLTGSYTFDSTASNLGDASHAVFDALTSLSFGVSGAGYSASSIASQEIQIDNFPPDPDRYAVVSRASDGLTGAPDPVNGNALSLFTIRLVDSTNTAISDATTLPTSISLSSFDSKLFFIDFLAPGTPAPVILTVAGTIDSLSSSSVPEPTSLAVWSVIAVLGIAFGGRRST